MWKRIKRLWVIFTNRPWFEVKRYGSATLNPNVSVSIGSRVGLQTLHTFPDDEQGNALATLAAKSLAHISGFPLYDNR